jgi:hypothetical protein
MAYRYVLGIGRQVRGYTVIPSMNQRPYEVRGARRPALHDLLTFI